MVDPKLPAQATPDDPYAELTDLILQTPGAQTVEHALAHIAARDAMFAAAAKARAVCAPPAASAPRTSTQSQPSTRTDVSDDACGAAESFPQYRPEDKTSETIAAAPPKKTGTPQTGKKKTTAKSNIAAPAGKKPKQELPEQSQPQEPAPEAAPADIAPRPLAAPPKITDTPQPPQSPTLVEEVSFDKPENFEPEAFVEHPAPAAINARPATQTQNAGTSKAGKKKADAKKKTEAPAEKSPGSELTKLPPLPRSKKSRLDGASAETASEETPPPATGESALDSTVKENDRKAILIDAVKTFAELAGEVPPRKPTPSSSTDATPEEKQKQELLTPEKRRAELRLVSDRDPFKSPRKRKEEDSDPPGAA